MSTSEKEREGLLRALSAAAFLMFLQAYLVAPLIPALARDLAAPESFVSKVIPAYMIPYGVSALVLGPLSDRWGRGRVILMFFALSALTTGFVAGVQTPGQLIAVRMIGGFCAGGIVPVSLALLGDLFPYRERGRPIGWIFGAIAAGTAFGSTLGPLLNPVFGWRAEFALSAVGFVAIYLYAQRHRQALYFAPRQSPLKETAFKGYRVLLRDRQAVIVYLFVGLNGLFHAGIFSWLGPYLVRRYQLGDMALGIALLGYGVPGMFLGPWIGSVADRFGRRRILPLGFLLAALCALALIPRAPLLAAAFAIGLLSLGFDMTQPLMAGIVTRFDPARRGQALALNAFALFVGFGTGALIFEKLMYRSFGWALGCFAALELGLAVTSLHVFKKEERADVQLAP